jgi:hypothetical protein
LTISFSSKVEVEETLRWKSYSRIKWKKFE